MTDSTDSSCSNDFDETNDSSSTVTDQLESNDPYYSTDVCQPSDQSDSKDKESLKRKLSETAPIDEPSKLEKSDISDTPSFLDIIKSVVKDDPNKVDNFNVLTNTKEYDCPIAKLAKLNPGDSFLKASKVDNFSDFNQTDNKPETPGTSESTEENGNTEEEKTVLESSISEDEILLREMVFYLLVTSI
ncbi:uncharacterized protein TA15985 [Theileria annulata]|uniref:Uncharacterized protein n=1 Tax=Theileria annulata TaxID=5874 RepID=Q4UFS8_THEAN|nr:uncharacterized protein TA15985 [Theileria annulata]CAI74038.1 hypothetical protein TA15985 [Theileria annulata]|eukprot:XP_951770.1 hypothetical protein TA15985 [Theileria annulata]